MVATDNGNPGLSATAIVYVTVKRNFRTPVITDNTKTLNILETQPLNAAIDQLAATDGDASVSITFTFLSANFLYYIVLRLDCIRATLPISYSN